MQPWASIAKSTGIFSLVSIVTRSNPHAADFCFTPPITTTDRYPRVIRHHLPQDPVPVFPKGNLPIPVCDLVAVLPSAGISLYILTDGHL